MTLKAFLSPHQSTQWMITALETFFHVCVGTCGVEKSMGPVLRSCCLFCLAAAAHAGNLSFLSFQENQFHLLWVYRGHQAVRNAPCQVETRCVASPKSRCSNVMPQRQAGISAML